jgi:hypothetical protein
VDAIGNIALRSSRPTARRKRWDFRSRKLIHECVMSQNVRNTLVKRFDAGHGHDLWNLKVQKMKACLIHLKLMSTLASDQYTGLPCALSLSRALHHIRAVGALPGHGAIGPTSRSDLAPSSSLLVVSSLSLVRPAPGSVLRSRALSDPTWRLCFGVCFLVLITFPFAPAVFLYIAVQDVHADG